MTRTEIVEYSKQHGMVLEVRTYFGITMRSFFSLMCTGLGFFGQRNAHEASVHRQSGQKIQQSTGSHILTLFHPEGKFITPVRRSKESPFIFLVLGICATRQVQFERAYHFEYRDIRFRTNGRGGCSSGYPQRKYA